MAAQPLSRWPWRDCHRLVRPDQSMRHFAQITADKYGLTLEQIKTRTYRRAISHPRQEAMAAMIEAGYSNLQAARYFGLTDHTTAVHARQAVAARALAEAEAA